MWLIKQRHNESLEYKREFVEQYKQNKKDKEIAETLEKKQLPKWKEVKMKKSFYLYVWDTIFSVWFNCHDYRLINLSNNKISWLSPWEEKTLWREWEIRVDEDDIKASRKHLKLRVDDENNLFLCDNSKHWTFVDNLLEDNDELQVFKDLIWQKKLWDWINMEDLLKIKKIQDELGVNLKKEGSLIEKYCKEISEIKDSYIEEVINSKKNLTNIMWEDHRDLSRVVFYLKLAENGILNSFIETFDIRPYFWPTLLDEISELKKYNYKKIKEMKSYIKSKNEHTIFDYDAIVRLNSLESIEYVWNILLKWVEKWWDNYVILNANKLWTDHIRAEKQWENEYIINAHMPDNPKMAGRAYILMFGCLPKWAKIVEKKSLSVNSFNNIINLYSNKKFQEKLGIKEVAIQNKVRLNNEWEDWELAKLIKDKNIWKDRELFETDSKDNAELIVNEINKLIYRHTWDDSIHAEVKEIEKDLWDNTWGVELPSYRIEKL